MSWRRRKCAKEFKGPRGFAPGAAAASTPLLSVALALSTLPLTLLVLSCIRKSSISFELYSSGFPAWTRKKTWIVERSPRPRELSKYFSCDVSLYLSIFATIGNLEKSIMPDRHFMGMSFYESCHFNGGDTWSLRLIFRFLNSSRVMYRVSCALCITNEKLTL